MRLVFVHGRGHGESTEEELERFWTAALKKGFENAFVDPPERLSVRFAFYGKVLDDAYKHRSDAVHARGSDEFSDPFEAVLILDIAERANISESDIVAELAQMDPAARGVRRGVEDSRWVMAANRVLAKRFPFISDGYIRYFTPDVHAYLYREDVRQKVNSLVAEKIGNEPAVVVGHSLGSVVIYWTLAELDPPASVPLMVTLGSPLGIPSVNQHVPRPVRVPSGVRHWLNAADTRDPIALFPRIDRYDFPDAEVENLSDIRNPRENRHSIEGYLSDSFVAKRIAGAIDGRVVRNAQQMSAGVVTPDQ